MRYGKLIRCMLLATDDEKILVFVDNDKCYFPTIDEDAKVGLANEYEREFKKFVKSGFELEIPIYYKMSDELSFSADLVHPTEEVELTYPVDHLWAKKDQLLKLDWKEDYLEMANKLKEDLEPKRYEIRLANRDESAEETVFAGECSKIGLTREFHKVIREQLTKYNAGLIPEFRYVRVYDQDGNFLFQES